MQHKIKGGTGNLETSRENEKNWLSESQPCCMLEDQNGLLWPTTTIYIRKSEVFWKNLGTSWSLTFYLYSSTSDDCGLPVPLLEVGKGTCTCESDLTSTPKEICQRQLMMNHVSKLTLSAIIDCDWYCCSRLNLSYATVNNDQLLYSNSEVQARIFIMNIL